METLAGVGAAGAVLLFVLTAYLLFAQSRIWYYSKQQVQLLREIPDQIARRDR